jgi:hypothetical protein
VLSDEERASKNSKVTADVAYIKENRNWQYLTVRISVNQPQQAIEGSAE